MRFVPTHVERWLWMLSTRAVMALAFVWPAIVWAQENAPPQPSLKRYPARVVGYLLVAVMLTIVVAVSLLPSKRGHQD